MSFTGEKGPFRCAPRTADDGCESHGNSAAGGTPGDLVLVQEACDLQILLKKTRAGFITLLGNNKIGNYRLPRRIPARSLLTNEDMIIYITVEITHSQTEALKIRTVCSLRIDSDTYLTGRFQSVGLTGRLGAPVFEKWRVPGS